MGAQSDQYRRIVMLAASALVFGYLVVWHLFQSIVDKGGLQHWQAVPVESYLLSCTILIICGVIVLLLRSLEEHRQLVYAEQYDQETGLPNEVRLKQLIERRTGSGQSIEGALIAVGIDGLASINVAHGYGVGNQVIRKIGEKLSAHVGRGVHLVRLSGDTFALYDPELRSKLKVAELSRQLLRIAGEPITVGDRSIFIALSIGATLGRESPPSAREFIRQAELSLLHARTETDNRQAIYSSELAAAAQRLGVLETGLREALETGQIEVHYQPLVDSNSDRIIGVEALARWTHPELGPISPGEFVAIAESIGLHEKLGNVILRRACNEIRPISNLVLAVNISANHLLHLNFLADLDHILRSTGFEASRLEIEITESVFMRLPEKVRAVTQELRARNISVALDDFGTGFSGLSYLENFTVDRIKIDSSFTGGLGISAKSEDIFRSIVELAQISGADVTVEGVETTQQLQFLRQFRGFWYQGFLFSKPMSYIDLLRSDMLRYAESRSEIERDGSRMVSGERRMAAAS